MIVTHYIARARDSRILELPEEAEALGILPGDAVSINVEREEASLGPTPNEAGLALLHELAMMKKDMRETDGSQTDRIIREGRSGAMYGL